MFQIATAADYKYDDLNRLVQMVYDDGQSVEYRYDSGGNILEVQTAMTTAELSVSPLKSHFGEIRIEQTAPVQSVTVTNIGDAALELGTIALNGLNAAEFKLVSDSCSGQPLAPDAACLLEISFAPASTGDKTAQLLGQSEDCESPFFSVILNGTGVTEQSEFYTLAVEKTGSGTGTVRGSGIDCGAVCQTPYAPGTRVTLTAAPDAGFTFVGWSGGACSGDGPCTVTMNADVTVTAEFTTSGLIITPTPDPDGVVPEPGTLVLVGLGLLGLLGLATRRNRRR